jgi:hypothetical protein
MFSRPAAQVSHEIAFDVTPLSNQIAALCAEIQMLPGLELSGRLSVSRSTLNDFISVWLYFFATVPETGTEQHRLGAIYFDANILRLSHNKASQRLDPALYKVPTEELFRDGDLLTTVVVISYLEVSALHGGSSRGRQSDLATIALELCDLLGPISRTRR